MRDTRYRRTLFWALLLKATIVVISLVLNKTYKKLMVQVSFVLSADHLQSCPEPFKHTRRTSQYRSPSLPHNCKLMVQGSFLFSASHLGHLRLYLQPLKHELSNVPTSKLLAFAGLQANSTKKVVLPAGHLESHLQSFKHTRHSRTFQHRRTLPPPGCQQMSSRSFLHKPSAH